MTLRRRLTIIVMPALTGPISVPLAFAVDTFLGDEPRKKPTTCTRVSNDAVPVLLVC